MAAKNKALEAAKEAARHHTTLCQLESVANIATGSDMHSSAYRTGQRIAALCRAEQQRQLARMDTALAKVVGGITVPDPQPKAPSGTGGGEHG